MPFPAGATTDMLARLFAQRMTEVARTDRVVENVGGAGGALGADQVAKAAPDGHTLLFHNITFTTTTTSLQLAGRRATTSSRTSCRSRSAPMCRSGCSRTRRVPANDLKEFVAYAKQTKDPLNYGSTGPGSIMNLMGEVLKRDAGIKMDHVPFRGAAPLVTEMLSGRIQFGGDQLSSSLQHVRSGALKAMAVATPRPPCRRCRPCGSSASPIWSCRAGTASSRPRARRRRSSRGCNRRSRPPPSIPMCTSG